MSEYIYCPYCDEEYIVLFNEYTLDEDGENTEYQCKNEDCNKHFKVWVSIEILKEYEAEEIEQPEPEEPVFIDHPNQTFFEFFQTEV